MGTWKDRTQRVPSEEAQVRGGGRNKGKEMNLKKIRLKINQRFICQRIRGKEMKEAEGAEETGCYGCGYSVGSGLGPRIIDTREAKGQPRGTQTSVW